MTKTDFNYDDISPGVRELVRELREVHGMDTVDSGDGWNYSVGMECAIPERHVFMQVSIEDMIEATEFLNETYEDAHVEATWVPGERAFILLWPDGRQDAAATE